MSKFPPLKAVHRYSITLFLKAQEKNDAISALLDRVNKIEPEEVLSEISSIFGRPMEAEFQAWLENDLSARQYQLELQRRALRDERRRLHEYASAGLSLRLSGHDFAGQSGAILGGFRRLPENLRAEPEIKILETRAKDLFDIFAHAWQDLQPSTFRERIKGPDIVACSKRQSRCWQGVNVTHEGFEDFFVDGARCNIMIAVLNLLHNAEYWCTKSEAKRGSGSVLILRHENSIFVADTGPGIPEDVSEQIFELGFSKAEEGVIHSYSKGLGLFLVKMSMEREGYKVILHQSPPPFIPPLYSGACFELNFAKETT